MGGCVASVVELVAYVTGELLLYALTFGRRRTRWPDEEKQSSAERALWMEGSTWLGFLFWAALIAALLFLFAR